MNPKEKKSRIKKYDQYEIEIKNNALSIKFLVKKIDKILQKLLIFSLVAQTILFYIMIYIYRNNIGENIVALIIFLVFLLTFLTILSIWYIRWNFLAEKKIELNSTGTIYYRELSGKMKKEQYQWKEIQEFVAIQYRGNKFLSIKKIDGTEKQLSIGMSEIEVQRLLFKLNGFKNSLLLEKK